MRNLKSLFRVCASIVLFTCVIGDQVGKLCDRCVPVQECPIVIGMTRAEQERWFEIYSCDNAIGRGDDITIPFGFAPLAKGDYVCCPSNNRGLQKPTQTAGTSIVFEDDPIRRTNELPERNKLRNNNQSNQRNEFGDIDSINGRPNERPIAAHSNNKGSQSFNVNQEMPKSSINFGNNQNIRNPNLYNPNTPNYASELASNERQGSSNRNTFGQQNKPIYRNNFQMPNPNEERTYFSQTQGPPKNDGKIVDSITSPEYDNSRILGRRPINNNFQNRRPNKRPNDRITNPTQSPYFLSQNPGGNGNSFENNRNGNSFGNRRIGNSFSSSESNRPSGVERGQCVLTNFPPEPSSGCCGRDPSSDRIIGSANLNNNPGSQVSSWFPKEEPGLGNFFQNLFGFSPRYKRAAKTNVTKVTIDSRITGGKVTDIDQFPWLVLLKTMFNYGNKEAAFNCGGSLISAKYVLTAAHCVKEEGARVTEKGFRTLFLFTYQVSSMNLAVSTKVKGTDQLDTVKNGYFHYITNGVEITLAEFDKRTFPTDCISTSEGRQCIENVVIHAEDVVSHPQYDDEKLQNDIALLRLRGKAPYTDFIRPICLPPFDIDNPDFANTPLSVAGWGRNGIYTSDVKQSTVVNLVAQRQCRRYYSQLTRRHLCAAGHTGEDTCKGDSGGPLMILYEGKYFISGIVSGKRADSPCGTSVPSLYTNVYQYLDWIRNNIRN